MRQSIETHAFNEVVSIFALWHELSVVTFSFCGSLHEQKSADFVGYILVPKQPLPAREHIALEYTVPEALHPSQSGQMFQCKYLIRSIYYKYTRRVRPPGPEEGITTSRATTLRCRSEVLYGRENAISMVFYGAGGRNLRNAAVV